MRKGMVDRVDTLMTEAQYRFVRANGGASYVRDLVDVAMDVCSVPGGNHAKMVAKIRELAEKVKELERQLGVKAARDLERYGEVFGGEDDGSGA